MSCWFSLCCVVCVLLGCLIWFGFDWFGAVCVGVAFGDGSVDLFSCLVWLWFGVVWCVLCCAMLRCCVLIVFVVCGCCCYFVVCALFGLLRVCMCY